MTGPLHGTRIIELSAIGRVPFAGALLAGMLHAADVRLEGDRPDRLLGLGPAVCTIRA